MCALLRVLLTLLSISFICAKRGYGPGEQDWGYIDTFEGGHMFYWLFYTTADVKNYTERPLVLWLGGPGVSATGNANFETLGPIDANGKKRKYAWPKYVNLLLVDNPVGIGYSYVDELNLLSKTNNEIAKNLVDTMKGFYKYHPEFLNVPFHIFGESYGGKMGIEFALEMWKASKTKSAKLGKLKSVSLGNPWISPGDTLTHTPRTAYKLGVIDEEQSDSLQKEFDLAQNFRSRGLWQNATLQLLKGLNKFCQFTAGMAITNILKPVKKHYDRSLCNITNLIEYSNVQNPNTLQTKMNSEIKKSLGIPSSVTWNGQHDAAVGALEVDFFKSTAQIVEQVLKRTDLEVNVFNGNLDLLVPTVATLSWIRKLKWSRKPKYKKANRDFFYVNNELEGFEKSGGGLSMIWILRSGHDAVKDAPSTLAKILKEKTGIKD